MSNNYSLTFKTKEFKLEEFRQIIERSKKLIKRGYFTGINFLQAEKTLPKNSIIIHFLHDSKNHLKEVEPAVTGEHFTVPRYTCYLLEPKYFKKPNFQEEYKNAIFFDQEFKRISIDEAIKNPYGVTVLNHELDLIVPILNRETLCDTVKEIESLDQKGPEPWLDPVLIVKTKIPVKTLDSFIDKQYVGIAKEKEEFYSILTDRERADALSKYLDKLCASTRIGNLQRSDVVFDASQVNKKFAEFLFNMQNQLRIFE